ncbi:MBOAT family O-acyltransferase [Bacillus sp. 3255]|uniref:MBOAT family O-acyltransferase n=1 Tax=Bacillus sp. 3255 TaxID=2817904 RepID=UPI0037C12AF6
MLILMSLIYYSYWYPFNLLVLLFSILFNYAFGTILNRIPSKVILTLGISFNLLLLGYFKYYNFFIQNINSFTHLSLQALSITLPIGISFFTFQKVGYLVDSYKQKTSHYKFSSYLLFVVFFPQLIAGPIVHHSKLVPQFSDTSIFNFNYENITRGIFLFTIGLSKKLLLADSLAPLANTVFDKSEGLTLLEAWGGALSYTLQLYFDFSGYSDMAIGLALIFNIKLPINFDSPYKSLNIIDFWRRWHITLSSFLRDYLYISLGGSRKGKFRKYLNLFITMVLGGIWHGAGWTYVIWGILHGLYLLTNHAFRDLGFKMSAIPARIMTLFFVTLAWIFFRANNLSDANKVLSGFLGLNGVKFHNLTYINKQEVILIIFAVIIVLLPNSNQILDKFKPNFRWFVFIMVLMILSLYSLNNPSQFLYFQF